MEGVLPGIVAVLATTGIRYRPITLGVVVTILVAYTVGFVLVGALELTGLNSQYNWLLVLLVQDHVTGVFAGTFGRVRV